MSSTVSQLAHSIFSYNGNVMLAAIISLLLVVLFVLLLHIYAKWFLAQARHRRRSSISVTHVLGPNRLHHFHTFTFDSGDGAGNCPAKGLEASVIASIPLFVYNSKEENQQMECVICLSGYEDGDIGRNLSKSCGHAFHVECIDMWLQSHSSCPICRAPVVVAAGDDDRSRGDGANVDANAIDTILSSRSLDIVIDIPDREVNDSVALSESEDSRASVTTPCCCQASSPSPVPAPATTIGCSLKRMMSCSRSKSERKVHPSSSNVSH